MDITDPLRKEAFVLKKIRFISLGGILTTIAVLFQSAPIFLPAVGLLFSPFSTLPVAIAALSNISLGFAVFFSSAFLLIFVHVQEAVIFLFTTGLLGIALGTFLYRKSLVVSILCSSVALSLGMMSLTYIAGISAFGDFASSESIPFTLFIYILFSLLYASIWNICLRKFISYLIRINVLTLNSFTKALEFIPFK